MKARFLVCIFSFFSLVIFAQDFKSDIKNVMEKYTSLDKFSMTVETIVFSTSTASQKIISQVMKDGESYKSVSPFAETLYNPSYVIAVSKQGNIIMYAPNDKKQVPIKDLLSIVDSSASYYDSIVYKGISNNDKHYVLYPKGSNISHVNIYIRPDFLFSKMDYVYKKSQDLTKVEISFRDIQTTPVFSKMEFDTKYYLSTTNPQKITPSKKYTGYKVIYNDFAERNKKMN